MLQSRVQQASHQKKFTETLESFANEQQKPERFLIDRTLYKGIKENDVGRIIDIGNDGGTMEQTVITEREQLEAILYEMRKKFDDVKTESSRVENEIDKRQKLLELLKTEETKYLTMLNNCKQDLSNVEKRQQDMANLVESSVFDQDIYLKMIEILKHDILILKKRGFDRDILLRKDTTKLRSLRNEEFNKTRLSYRCKDMLQSIEKTVNHKQIERRSKINSFYDVLNRRYDTLRKKQHREKELEEVMTRAMSEKMQEEKEWINICLANIFLKKFLKCQMQKTIEQNLAVETAFQNIRINTDVSDSREFIQRFLNREKNYGMLLQSISSKESILENLKEEKGKLENINRDLHLQAEQINQVSVKKSSEEVDRDQRKMLSSLEDSLKFIGDQKDLMYRWGIKLLTTYHQKTKEEVQTIYKRDQLDKLFIDSLKLLTAFTTNILLEENNEQKINKAFLETKPLFRPFEGDTSKKNYRIRTQSVFDEFTEEDDNNQNQPNDDSSEMDYLQYNRRMTKKNDQSRRFRIKTKPN